ERREDGAEGQLLAHQRRVGDAKAVAEAPPELRVDLLGLALEADVGDDVARAAHVLGGGHAAVDREVVEAEILDLDLARGPGRRCERQRKEEDRRKGAREPEGGAVGVLHGQTLALGASSPACIPLRAQFNGTTTLNFFSARTRPLYTN